jgi:hypothetical protein
MDPFEYYAAESCDPLEEGFEKEMAQISASHSD